MKNRILSVLSGFAIIAASFVAPSVEAAPDPTGIFSLSWPGSGDLGDNLIVQYASSGTGGRGLPATVTNTAAVSATNVISPIIQGSDLAITLVHDATPTNAVAATNSTWRFVVSPNGRDYTTVPWITLSSAISGSNEVVRTWLIGNTNLAGLSHIKLLTVSNGQDVGSGSLLPSRIIFSQKRRGIRAL